MSSSGSVAKNTLLFSGALVLQKVFSFIYFTLIARAVGVSQLGEYLAALAFAMIFSLFMDMGISQVLIRETARSKEKAWAYLNNVLGIKLVFSIAAFAGMMLIIWILDISSLNHPPIDLVALAGLVMIFDAFTLSLYSTLRGYTHLGFESVGTVLHKLVVMGFGLSFLYFAEGDIYSLMWALVIGGVFNLTYLYGVYGFRFSQIPAVLFDKKIWKWFLKLSWPFALAGFFAAVFANVDSVLLRVMISEEEVGIYGVASKITGALQFIPLAFVAAIYPAMSKAFPSDLKSMQKIFEESLRFLILLALPIMAGTWVIGKTLIVTLYGAEYANSVLPLSIMMVALMFIFLNFPVGYLFNASNRQLQNTINLGIAVGANIILNVILIPMYQSLGAAIAVLGAYIVYFLVGMILARKVVKYRVSYVLRVTLQAGIAAAIMYGVLQFVITSWNLLAVIFLGMIVYGVSIILVGGISKGDIITIASFIPKRRHHEKTSSSHNA